MSFLRFLSWQGRRGVEESNKGRRLPLAIMLVDDIHEIVVGAACRVIINACGLVFRVFEPPPRMVHPVEGGRGMEMLGLAGREVHIHQSHQRHVLIRVVHRRDVERLCRLLHTALVVGDGDRDIVCGHGPEGVVDVVARRVKGAAVAEIPHRRDDASGVGQLRREFYRRVVACHVGVVGVGRHDAHRRRPLRQLRTAAVSGAEDSARRGTPAVGLGPRPLRGAVNRDDDIIPGEEVAAKIALQHDVEGRRRLHLVHGQHHVVGEPRPLHRGAALAQVVDRPAVEHALAALVGHLVVAPRYQRAGADGQLMRQAQLRRLQLLHLVYIVIGRQALPLAVVVVDVHVADLAPVAYRHAVAAVPLRGGILVDRVPHEAAALARRGARKGYAVVETRRVAVGGVQVGSCRRRYVLAAARRQAGVRRCLRPHGAGRQGGKGNKR